MKRLIVSFVAVMASVLASIGIGTTPAYASVNYVNVGCGPTSFQVTLQIGVSTTYDFILHRVILYNPPTAGYSGATVRVYLDDAYTRRWSGIKTYSAGQNVEWSANAASRFLGATFIIRVYPGNGPYLGHGCNILIPHFPP